jgi:HAD superfamily 5'-nucleotidase-like hydrolase
MNPSHIPEVQSEGKRPIPDQRGVFCNRTLNMRTIRAIGYDMDYTLIHYKVHEWEGRAYAYIKEKLQTIGWPVENLEFDADKVIRSLTLDTQLGNTLKVDRFGYVKRARHGTRLIDFKEQRKIYARTLIDLHDDRFEFLNTLFSLSEAWMFGQLVDLLDQNKLPAGLSYRELYQTVRASTDEAHMEGRLKSDIIADPDRFVDLDPDTPLALLDQKQAGKKMLLITNSEWSYSSAMMEYAFDRYLPDGMTWRDLFDVIIVSARKPVFFSTNSPLFRVVTEEGLLEPCPTGLKDDGIYLGGNARYIEEYLGLSGDEILYVGDHMFTDVHVTKDILRWRTALIVRELEGDLAEAAAYRDDQSRLAALMRDKEKLEVQLSHLRLNLQRKKLKYGPVPDSSRKELETTISAVRKQLFDLDNTIRPFAGAAAAIGNDRWGPLMRAGNDKSFLARQVERYADIYLSRVSNFLTQTPFTYLRSHRGSLPHDPEDVALVAEGDDTEGAAE